MPLSTPPAHFSSGTSSVEVVELVFSLESCCLTVSTMLPDTAVPPSASRPVRSYFRVVVRVSLPSFNSSELWTVSFRPSSLTDWVRLASAVRLSIFPLGRLNSSL